MSEHSTNTNTSFPKVREQEGVSGAKLETDKMGLKQQSKSLSIKKTVNVDRNVSLFHS